MLLRLRSQPPGQEVLKEWAREGPSAWWAYLAFYVFLAAIIPFPLRPIHSWGILWDVSICCLPLKHDKKRLMLTRSSQVCQSSPRSIIVWPCRCLSLCDDCRVTLAMNNFDKCVCCRRDVVSFSRVFVPWHQHAEPSTVSLRVQRTQISIWTDTCSFGSMKHGIGLVVTAVFNPCNDTHRYLLDLQGNRLMK